MKENKQEQLIKIRMLQQQSEETQQQLDFIEKQVSELEDFNKTLSSLVESKSSEILASLGKGVYLKTDLHDKNLYVEVGSGVIIKKTPEETIEVIKSQIKKFKEMETYLSNQLESFTRELSSASHSLESISGSKTE